MNKLSFYIFALVLHSSFQLKAQVTWVEFPYFENDSTINANHDEITFKKLEGGWTLVKQENWWGGDIGEWAINHNDIAFYNDSVYSILYPCEYYRSRRVLARPDTILSIYRPYYDGYEKPISYHVQSIQWSNDTLILVNHFGGGGLEGSKEFFVRQEMPYDSLLALKKSRINTGCISGKWKLAIEDKIVRDNIDTNSFRIPYYNLSKDQPDTLITDFFPLRELDFDNADVTFNADTLTYKVDGVDYEYILLKEFSSIKPGRLCLIPKSECSCTNLNLMYLQVNE